MIGISLAVLATIAGGGVLAGCQAGGAPSGIGEGPVMLYFYATW